MTELLINLYDWALNNDVSVTVHVQKWEYISECSVTLVRGSKRAGFSLNMDDFILEMIDSKTFNNEIENMLNNSLSIINKKED